MHLRLHANAITTPRTRAYIQKSIASHATLARELGIHPCTVAPWKARGDVADRSTRPHRLATALSAWEEALILEQRRSLVLPLDDIVEAMRRCLNPQLSRSGAHRCLKRKGLSARLTPQQAPAVAFQTETPAGFIHIDVEYLPPLGRRRSYAYVAIDRDIRFVYLEILPDRRGATAAAFSTMPNAMPISSPSSPITTAPDCDASTTKHPPSSSLNSRDTTLSPGKRAILGAIANRLVSC